MKFRLSQFAESVCRKPIKTVSAFGIVRGLFPLTTAVALGVGLALVLLAPSPAFAACNVTFNPGDNLPAIVSASASGTSFCFNPGTYRMTTYITPKNNDVFSGSPGAILNGSELVTSWTQSGSYWVASKQPQLIPQTTSIACMANSTACQFSDALFLDNTPLNRVMSLSEVVPGTFYRDYASQQIYIAQNPTGHTMEVIVCDHPILAVGTGVTGVTIEGLTIEKFAGDIGGAVQGSSTWIIQNNEVRLNHGIGIDTNGKVVGNYVHDNGNSGIGGGYASTTMDVENNEIAFNNWAGFGTAGGAWFSYTTNLIVRNNYSHDNNGPGFHADTDNLNALFEYNHSKNNKDSGIDYEISWNAIIRYNLLEEETSVTSNVTSPTSIWNHNTISVLNSSNVQVYGNTINNSTNGIAGVFLAGRGNSTHGPHTGQPYLLQNLDVHDNTLFQISNNAAGIVGAGTYGNSMYTSWNNHFTNDTYYLADLNGLNFTWVESSSNNTYTWSQWQSFGNDVQGTLESVSSAGTTEPSVPTNLSATAVSSSQINLIWTASTDKVGVTEYKIYREGTQIGTSTTNIYSDSGLSAGTTYSYTVAAVDAKGNISAQSAYAEATTPSSGSTSGAPSVPTNLSATAISSSQINLTWTASTGATEYKIYRYGSGILVGTSATTTYSDSRLLAGTAYKYRVAASDAAGHTSTQSAYAEATTPSSGSTSGAPSVPTNLSATAVSSSQINLTWTASTGATEYKIYRYGSGILAGTSATTTYSDSRLLAGTAYKYRVAAVYAAGQTSAQSAYAEATTFGK